MLWKSLQNSVEKTVSISEVPAVKISDVLSGLGKQG